MLRSRCTLQHPSTSNWRTLILSLFGAKHFTNSSLLGLAAERLEIMLGCSCLQRQRLCWTVGRAGQSRRVLCRGVKSEISEMSRLKTLQYGADVQLVRVIYVTVISGPWDLSFSWMEAGRGCFTQRLPDIWNVFGQTLIKFVFLVHFQMVQSLCPPTFSSMRMVGQLYMVTPWPFV